MYSIQRALLLFIAAVFYFNVSHAQKCFSYSKTLIAISKDGSKGVYLEAEDNFASDTQKLSLHDLKSGKILDKKFDLDKNSKKFVRITLEETDSNPYKAKLPIGKLQSDVALTGKDLSLENNKVIDVLDRVSDHLKGVWNLNPGPISFDFMGVYKFKAGKLVFGHYQYGGDECNSYKGHLAWLANNKPIFSTAEKEYAYLNPVYVNQESLACDLLWKKEYKKHYTMSSAWQAYNCYENQEESAAKYKQIEILLSGALGGETYNTSRNGVDRDLQKVKTLWRDIQSDYADQTEIETIENAMESLSKGERVLFEDNCEQATSRNEIMECQDFKHASIDMDIKKEQYLIISRADHKKTIESLNKVFKRFVEKDAVFNSEKNADTEGSSAGLMTYEDELEHLKNFRDILSTLNSSDPQAVYKKDIKKLDKQLNQAYRKIIKSFNPSLRYSQRQWLRYRDALINLAGQYCGGNTDAPEGDYKNTCQSWVHGTLLEHRVRQFDLPN